MEDKMSFLSILKSGVSAVTSSVTSIFKTVSATQLVSFAESLLSPDTKALLEHAVKIEIAQVTGLSLDNVNPADVEKVVSDVVSGILHGSLTSGLSSDDAKAAEAILLQVASAVITAKTGINLSGVKTLADLAAPIATAFITNKLPVTPASLNTSSTTSAINSVLTSVIADKVGVNLDAAKQTVAKVNTQITSATGGVLSASDVASLAATLVSAKDQSGVMANVLQAAGTAVGVDVQPVQATAAKALIQTKLSDVITNSVFKLFGKK